MPLRAGGGSVLTLGLFPTWELLCLQSLALFSFDSVTSSPGTENDPIWFMNAPIWVVAESKLLLVAVEFLAPGLSRGLGRINE